MADSNINTLNALSAEGVKFYSNYMIDITKPRCAYRHHAQLTKVPKNSGRTVNWRNYAKFPVNPTALTEGVIPDGKKMSILPIEGQIKFYGDYVTTTDQLKLTSVDDLIMETIKRLGVQAAETLDFIAGSEYCNGSNVIYAGEVNGRGGLTTDSTITVDLLIKAAQFLKINSAPTIGGSFYSIVHPAVGYDLRTYKDANGNNPFIDVSKYANTEAIVSGEIGKIHGIKFIETPNAITTTVDGTKDSAPVYQTIIYGENAFGAVDLEGGNLKTIVKPLGSAGSSDPLDMIASVGWKAAECCKILNNDNVIRIESCSKYGM